MILAGTLRARRIGAVPQRGRGRGRALQHPNIVQLYEVGEDGGHPFFCSNTSTATASPGRSTARRSRPTMPWWRSALADGMEYAHRRGIVHRDLKPANVLLTADGQPKIGDFGLVKRIEDESSQTRSGRSSALPITCRPSRRRGASGRWGRPPTSTDSGRSCTSPSTGRPPFRAASVLDTLQQVRTQEPVSPSQLLPKVPRDLETICLKCLQKDALKRDATAADLREDLRLFLSGEPIHCAAGQPGRAALGGACATGGLRPRARSRRFR